MSSAGAAQGRIAGQGFPWLRAALALLVFAILIGLGTWQMQRLAWKEALIATIGQRIASPPAPLADIETLFAGIGDVDYWPVKLSGTFLNEGERHFLATFEGQSGFYVYTPLAMADGRFVFVNRGFVPYDRKDAASRPESWPKGEVTVAGLARNPLLAKPSFLVPDNDPAKNIFYWKDLAAMKATAGLPSGAAVLPFFVDANATPNPGGLPVGGVTIVELPNNHLQYAVTWYGLAAALAAVMAYAGLRRLRAARGEGA